MSSRDHGCMRVVCPFCPKEKLFKRSTPELKEHVASHHPTDLKDLGDKDFFAERNGFWMAIHPKDYKRLVQPSPYQERSSVKARELVRTWFEKAKVSRHRREEWESGWRLQMNEEPGEEAFVPDYEEDLEPSTKKLKYSPEDPDIRESLQLCAVEFNFNPALTLHSQDHTLWYRITLRPLNKEPKIMASVLRRVQSCSTDPPIFNDLKHPGKRLTKHLAETVGVQEGDVLKVMKGMQPLFSHAQEENLTEAQIEQREEKNVQEEESRKGEKSNSKKIEKDKRVPCKERTKEKHQEMTEEASVPTKEQEGDNTDVIVDHEGTSAKPEDSIQDLCISQTPFSSETPFVPDANTPNYARSPTVAEEYPGNCNLDIILAIPVADASILSGVHDQKMRAMKLLAKGVMPLCPPAKREWDGIQTITILDGPVPLQWPPANWKTFSPEQKLHAWEMAAMYVTSREALDFSLDRNYLLSCFNFLSLSGSSMPILPKEQTNEVNMRLCNYRAICDIALFGTKSIQQEKFLDMLEGCAQQRDASLDWIIEIIERHNVNLRLPKLPN